MKTKQILKIENYFEAFLVIGLIILFFWLIKSYLMAIFLASIFVFLTYNIQGFLSKKIHNKTISALFILFLVLTIILLPLYMVTITLINESSSLVYGGSELVKNIDFQNCNNNYCTTIKNNLQFIDIKLDKILTSVGGFIISSASAIFNSITSIFLNLFIFILAFFFMLRDGDSFLIHLKRLIPMKAEYKRALFIRFRDVSEAVFFDNIFVALIQGSLVALGFMFFGLSSPIFWGLIASFFALLPMIGTAIIWLPATIIVFFSDGLLISGLFILYFSIIVGLSDNILRPLLLKKKLEVHPFLILLSVLGGIKIFGFFGVFIGPVIISLLISVLHLYKLDFY